MRHLLAATAAVMILAGPALAQDAAPAPASPPAASAEQRAMEAEGAQFEARMEAMGQELEAAVQAAGGDQAKTMADVDGVLARYQDDIDSFANRLEAYLKAEAEKTADPEQKAGFENAAVQAKAAISSIPNQVRAGVREGLNRPAPAPAPAQE